jgi:hypothetical protein
MFMGEWCGKSWPDEPGPGHYLANARSIVRFLLPSLCLLALAATASADDAGIDFFEKKIRPVLAEHCYQCHSTQAKKLRGGLALDSRDGVRKGGDSGPALVPGRPEQSLLLKAVSYADEELKMPPNGKLPAAVVADLRRWVEMGAPDPRDKTAALVAGTVSWEEALRSRRRWWSLQPVRKPALPRVRDAGWSNQAVDRFLLAKLEQAGLTPAGPADRRTLIRRLSLVLTGLLPAPEEVEAFAHDEAPDAYEKLVDRLLASPHFGERWARHWMDVVRYAETHGFEWNYEVHHAWRYRDYLIRAFNEDVPYDQLVREHLAGDLLPEPRRNRQGRFNESVIGTAFYRFGEVGHDDCIEFREIGLDAVDNQIDTLSKAFQATTIACARCHDHKLDAVSMKDYYALLGILQSSRQVSHTIDDREVNQETIARLRRLKDEIRQELAGLWLVQARAVGKSLQALPDEKPALEDPLHPWQALRRAVDFPATWKDLAARYEREIRERTSFNSRNFTSLDHFARVWSGQGLLGAPTHSGDFAVGCEGDRVVGAIFPAGYFTHTLSERLNGTVSSEILWRGKKHISLQVLGGRGSAARLVTNNCQLNYKNFKYLANDRLGWITFAVNNSPSLHQYFELMTKLNNPKFPDQLGELSGGPTMRVPWEKAVADPRSFFGVTQAVRHDCNEPPRDDLTHIRPLLIGLPPKTQAELGARYAMVAETAVQAWAAGHATDEGVRWIDTLLRRGLLSNSVKQAPKLAALVAQYRESEKQLVTPRVVPGLADFCEGSDHPLFIRGDYHKPGATVPRRYLEVLQHLAPAPRANPFGLQFCGRRELAECIANPQNPLTARVMVNRLWHHVFGAGLVRTVDDFGHVGERPSHPELLDWLAARFVEDGWSIKGMIRLLVLSRAFQQSSRQSAEGRQADPQNRLLHHYPARRMEAEAIRDAILAASGRLDRTLYGPSVQPYREKENADRRLFPGPLDGRGRRSLYIKPTLMEGPSFLKVFNFPAGKVCQGRRDVTNVPAQALALLNDPFVLQQADVWAARLVARPDGSVAARVEHLFRVALGRPPDEHERERFTKTVGEMARLHGVAAENVLRSQAVWKDVAQALFNCQEFIYIR